MTNRFTRSFFGGGPWTAPRAMPVARGSALGKQPAALGQQDPRVARVEKVRGYAQSVIRHFDFLRRYLGEEAAMEALDQAERAVDRAEQAIEQEGGRP